jgi:hypothetical protein
MCLQRVKGMALLGGTRCCVQSAASSPAQSRLPILAAVDKGAAVSLLGPASHSKVLAEVLQAALVSGMVCKTV